MVGISIGGLAMLLLSGSTPGRAPEGVLRQRQVFAATRRAHVLIVRALRQAVPDVERAFDPFQDLHVQLRVERLPAADTDGLLSPGASPAVEVHPHLRGPLEDVEEL